MSILIGALLGCMTALVLSTRRIGILDWQFWAIFVLGICSQLLGALS